MNQLLTLYKYEVVKNIARRLSAAVLAFCTRALNKQRNRVITHSCEPIDPLRNSISCKLIAHIITEVVAVLDDQVICIAIIAL